VMLGAVAMTTAALRRAVLMTQPQPQPNQQKAYDDQGRQAPHQSMATVPSLHNSGQGANDHDKILR
jgi:hypothetical protein